MKAPNIQIMPQNTFIFVSQIYVFLQRHLLETGSFDPKSIICAKPDSMAEAGFLTKCPNCGKEIAGSGYEFGKEIRTACYECSCGTRFYVDRTPKETYEKLGLKIDGKARRPKKRFHCRVCNGLVIRQRDEKDELTALRRHYAEVHSDLPVPRSIEFAECDLTKREKECVKALNDMIAQIDSVMPEVVKELKAKGIEVPNENPPKKRISLGVF